MPDLAQLKRNAVELRSMCPAPQVSTSSSRPNILQGLSALTALTGLEVVHLPADNGVPPEPRPVAFISAPSTLQLLKVQSHYDDNVPGSFVLTNPCLVELAARYPQLTKLEFDGAMAHFPPSMTEVSKLTSLKELHLTHDEHGMQPAVSVQHLPPSLVHVTMMSMCLLPPAAASLPALLSLDLEWSNVQVRRAGQLCSRQGHGWLCPAGDCSTLPDASSGQLMGCTHSI